MSTEFQNGGEITKFVEAEFRILKLRIILSFSHAT